MLQRNISESFFKSLEKIENGSLNFISPEGKSYIFGNSTHNKPIIFKLNNWQAIKKLIYKGDIGFAEIYQDGSVETEDLTSLLNLCLNNEEILNKYIFGSKLQNLTNRLKYLLNLNTIKGSKKNILAHYDLGNNFYKLWLDQSLTYSAAIYKNKQESLEIAQNNKYQKILENLPKKTGRILEIGCGWGGFAEAAYNHGSYDIKGITLSTEQHKFAKSRLNNKVEIALEDYRMQKNKYDYIISIEMFEAVGRKYWHTYFSKIKELLNDSGKAIIQTITIDDKYFKKYNKSGDLIRSFIFPGGMLPTETLFKEAAYKSGLKCQTPYFFGQDYAKTIRKWLTNFKEKQSEIKKLGFDSSFIRLWELYLASCIAGFESKRINVMQIELKHA
jgi:cyclopropane-fatty-acyl-phospholipid synthase